MKYNLYILNVNLGMTTVADFARNMRSLKIRQEVPRIIKRTSNVLLDFNKDQLQHGFTSEGETGAPLRGYRSFDYSVYKNSINSLPDFGIPDLKLTGAFYNGFRIDVDAISFTIYSTDPKAFDLETKYTIYIYGVNNKNLTNYVQNTFYPEFKDYIFQKTGLVLI